jgi:hypothetical protein
MHAVETANGRAVVDQARILARSGRLQEALAAFLAALRHDDRLLDAHLGIYEVAQLLRQPELALAHQRTAIALAPVHSTPAEQEQLSLLVLCAPGLYTANTPIDLLFDPERVSLHRWYVDPDGRVPPLPPHDAVFVAIGESDRAKAHLDAAERHISSVTVPVINRPARISALGRVPLAATFSAARFCRVAPASRISLVDYAAQGFPTPHIVRPVDAHGGHQLARIESDPQRDAYLATTAAPSLYVAPFVDYVSDDGFYRKYRIVFIDGVAYPFHLAISPHWMVHYYNAQMTEHPWMRAEERAFLGRMGDTFSGSLAAALIEASELLGLDYVTIDCAIDRDGGLRIFEADNAAIVHLLDDPTTFGYKHEFVPRIFAAAEAMLHRRVAALRPAQDDVA